MRKTKRIIVTGVICAVLLALAYFALYLPFYQFGPESFTTSLEKIFSFEYIKNLIPLFIITGASALGIVLTVSLRKRWARKHVSPSVYSKRYSRGSGKAPKPQTSLFMILRWVIMIVFAFMMIWGGLLFGLKTRKVSIPVFACPWNTEQMTETSCYYLSHLTDLFKLPLKEIIIFLGSTVTFIIVLGRAMCGFLCPMGLVQDIMDKIRKKLKIKGMSANERIYSAFKPIKWFMILLFLGLCFIGGNFCYFCPAMTVSPILAGLGVSLYFSGFLMIFILIGSFFKRRIFCNVCPLGHLVGMLHKISLFRIKKDCTACTECGACYEACPMGIKTIYTERSKVDVTEADCIMCGECVKCCPEDKALSLTFAGKQIYTSSRSKIMSGYAPGKGRGE